MGGYSIIDSYFEKITVDEREYLFKNKNLLPRGGYIEASVKLSKYVIFEAYVPEGYATNYKNFYKGIYTYEKGPQESKHANKDYMCRSILYTNGDKYELMVFNKTTTGDEWEKKIEAEFESGESKVAFVLYERVD
ncbi:hypothetical protein ENBRE01_1072 [Enteropsectra breve]|nr:hypothetical protein ENBRE01_1072 [Enteropsectra breve]